MSSYAQLGRGRPVMKVDRQPLMSSDCQGRLSSCPAVEVATCDCKPGGTVDGVVFNNEGQWEVGLKVLDAGRFPWNHTVSSCYFSEVFRLRRLLPCSLLL